MGDPNISSLPDRQLRKTVAPKPYFETCSLPDRQLRNQKQIMNTDLVRSLPDRQLRKYTNKLIIMPHGRKGDFSHKWLGDIKDTNLKKAIIQREVNDYNLMKEYKWQVDSFNATLRAIKVNLGVDLKFNGFKGFDPNYRLSYERK